MTATIDAPQILIVDDQPRNLDALEAMLEPIDCITVRALSADEALLSLLRCDFAAIVLDIQMPGMNGLELARLIKQRKRSKDVPILFLTAHMVDESDALQGYGVGAVDYLSKPLNPEILRSKIGVFIELFRKTRALARLNEALQGEIEAREKAQAALELANSELERRVQQRTSALTRAHRGVRENEERLRMAMAVARIGAWEWHLRTGRMEWSSDPEALFGFPSGAFGPELRTIDVIHPADKAARQEAVAAALDSGSYEAEYRLVRPDESIVWITERGRIVPDGDGIPERMVGISRDITSDKDAVQEREQLLQRAREARDEAERQGRLKDEFLATLSHELRTPMNAILGWLSILESGKPLRDVYAALAVIRRNADLQARLIEDLLDMNRLLSGNFQLELGKVDVGGLLKTTIQGLQPAADAKGVQLIASIDSSLGDITADARRLQQVLWNLVHNGIKFTPAMGRVEIHISHERDRLRVAVQDTGCGIGPDFLPHVFERFRQEDASPTRGASGLGLGLSIAKHLVELHGGTIQASSAGAGSGATFAVEIPSTPHTIGDGSQIQSTRRVMPALRESRHRN
jgi:PAS domain S-box-containing protein